MCATIYRQLFKSLVELDDFPIFYMGNVSMVNRAQSKQIVSNLGKDFNSPGCSSCAGSQEEYSVVGLLNKFDYKVVFQSDKLIVSKGGIYVGQCYYCNRMFKFSIHAKNDTDSIYLLDVSSLWHNRLCYN